jgi:undecaprenyl phosphate-alpha-L-ara4FN deformylase
LVDQPIRTSAAAGWRATEAAIAVKNSLGFDYNSDCRGSSIFIPQVGQREMVPQIPVTLPTYDEIIGSDGVTDHSYNDAVLDAIRPDALNVYAVHAEVEGMARAALFDDLLHKARARGMVLQPLRQLLQGVDLATLPRDRIFLRRVPGREGWVSWQAGTAMMQPVIDEV